MWIVYVGSTMQSAWDSVAQATLHAEKLTKQGKTGLRVKYAAEFAGLFNNGYIFGYN